ncbi:MAG: hypothetical protein H0W09_03255 [Solirubrobacterales bacterium]|nr:hypothetical protein [Solirubrobacterales bacterium]
MDFLLIVGLLALIVVVLVLVSSGHPGSGADLVGLSSRHSNYEAQAQVEADELGEMVKAQNEYRRRRGKEKLTGAELRRWVSEDEDTRRRGRELQELEEQFEIAPEAREGEGGRPGGGGERPGEALGDEPEAPRDQFPGGWRER